MVALASGSRITQPPHFSLHKSLLFTVLFALTGFAGSPASAMDVDGPPWEASFADIRQRMATEPAVAAQRAADNHLAYQGGTLAGQTVEYWQFLPPAGDKPPRLVVRLARSDTAFPDLLRLLTGKYGPAYEFQSDVRHDALWTTGPSTAFPGMSRHTLLTAITTGGVQQIELLYFDAPAAPTGNLRTRLHYTLHRDPNPTPEQVDAYRRITDAMDRAVRFYEEYTVGLVKDGNVFLVPNELTADGNINGNINFGPHDISLRTALHEIAHTVGIGTTHQYELLLANGQFTGRHAVAQLRAITGDSHAVFHADYSHFWSYGLIYNHEDRSIWDYIYHCQMVSAIIQDCREIR